MMPPSQRYAAPRLTTFDQGRPATTACNSWHLNMPTHGMQADTFDQHGCWQGPRAIWLIHHTDWSHRLMMSNTPILVDLMLFAETPVQKPAGVASRT